MVIEVTYSWILRKNQIQSSSIFATGDGTVSVHNVVTKEGKSPNEICGYATIPDIDNEPGRLAVYFPDVPVAGDYRILDTDYENWAAVYSCSNFDIFGLFRYTYLLTRSQSRNESAVSMLNAIDNQFINEMLIETISILCSKRQIH